MAMPEFKAPETFDPNNWGGMAPAAVRTSLSPDEVLAKAQARKKPSAAIQTAQPQAAQTTVEPTSAEAKPAVYSSGPYYSGDVERDTAKWREDAARRVDERTAAINSKKQANADARAKFDASGDVGNYNIKPASGSYNQNNVDIQRNQDDYWANKRQIQDAKYALDNYTHLSKADRAMYEDRMKGGQAGLAAMRTDDTARRGQDTTRYGYDQQRATGQDSNTSRQMLQDTDPTKPAGAIEALQRGGLYGEQTKTAQQANARSAMLNSLFEKASALDETSDPGGKQRSALKEQYKLLSGAKSNLIHGKGAADPVTQLPGADWLYDPDTKSLIDTSGRGATGGLAPERAAQIAKEKGVSVEAVYADYNAHAQKKYAQGGAVGYAQGGEIASPLADPMQQVHPMVGEYRRYSMMAQQLGATPVSFEQFGALRQAADTQGHQVAPMQENFNKGGAVPEESGVGAWLREKLMPETTARIRGDRTARELERQTGGDKGGGMNRSGYDKPRPEVRSSDPETDALLRKYRNYAEGGEVMDWNDNTFSGGDEYAEGGGVGAWLREKLMPETTAAIRGDQRARQIDQQTGVQKAVYVPPSQPRQEVHSSDPETEALLRKYKGYAEGGDVGAIPVGGRQVLGPGDGKSDSIPAVIDGKRPAALSTGEFVFPVEAVRHFGMDRLNKMVEAARKPQGA